MKENYVQATLELIESGKDIDLVLSGLIDTLKKDGHMKLHSAILKVVLRTIEAQTIALVPVVTLNSEQSKVSLTNSIAQAITAIGGNTQEYLTKIDESIIGGFMVEYNHKQIDMSYKTKLSKLYQAVTK